MSSLSSRGLQFRERERKVNVLHHKNNLGSFFLLNLLLKITYIQKCTHTLRVKLSEFCTNEHPV